jgi:Mg-chelatase subunit ChlD
MTSVLKFLNDFVLQVWTSVTSLTLLSPIWLFLLIPLALCLWLWRPPTRFLLGVRCLSVLLVVLALAGVALRLPSQAGTVIVVVDRSLSMPDGSDKAALETIDLIHSVMGTEDRLGVVCFGQQVAIEQGPQSGKPSSFIHQVGGNASNLGEAIDAALSLIPRDSPGRLLVLSDGKWTGRDPASLAPSALARNIAIDFRALERPAAGDLAVARVDVPSVVAAGESFLLTGWVFAPTPQEVSFVLKKGETIISQGKRKLNSGMNRLTFRDRATQVGNQAYTLNVSGSEKDPVPENNTARFLVGVSGPRPILHVSDSPTSGLARLLRGGGLDIRLARPESCRWELEDLQRFSAVILENVPAEKIGNVGMETLAAYVRETGAGLMMTGGRSAYGPGGYYKSPLEPIMPVSMELRNEHRKLSLSIVVAMDRSGSMSVPAGTGGKVKMDLANEGAAQVLELLGPMDEFCCLAVDTEVHTIAPLRQVKDQDKPRIRKDILSVRSQGGGIYVYEALSAAAQIQLKAKSGTRHILLFSDAADSEMPGDYRSLVAQCNKAGITISVIGLGTERDVDAELLKDIARLGKGRIFFSDRPEELPRLFAQDTFVVARNTFIDEPVGVQTTAGLATMMEQELRSPANLKIGGYNLCYLRPEATLATVTLDEYKAPVAASWRAGAGRVVCYTGEADGKYAGGMAKWSNVGEYFTSLARWTAGSANPLREGMLLTQEVREGVNVVQLHLDPERKGDPFASLPRVATLRSWPGGSPQVENATLRWTGADTLAIEVPLDGGETTLTTIDIPGHGVVSLPPVCLPYSPEFKPGQNDRGLATLERLGRSTAGRERVDLANIWKDLPRNLRLIPVGRWLLLVAVGLWLVEVLERRTAILSALRRRQRAPAEKPQPVEKPAKVAPIAVAAAKAAVKTAPAPAAAATPARKEEPAPAPAPAPRPVSVPMVKTEAGGMSEALRKARQRAKGRTE